jgi:hypothetical protein
MLDRSDTNHEQAAGLWASLLEKDFYLCTGNYVIVGTLALLQSRLGSESGNLWYRDVLTLAETLRIDGSMPNLAYELWLSLRKLHLRLGELLNMVHWTIIRRHIHYLQLWQKV